QQLASTGDFFFPKFSPDGSKIHFTKSNFEGIYEFNRNTNSITELTDEQGAGYEFIVTKDSELYYRSDKFENGRKYSSLKVMNLNNRSVETIEVDKRELSTPCILQNGRVVYTIKKNLKSIERLNKSNINETEVSDPVLFIEDSKIAMYINSKKRILQPLGEGNYIWPSLSPDKTKLLFTLAGTGTFV